MNTIRQADEALELQPPAAADDSTMATVVRPALPRYVLRGVAGAGFGRTFPLVGPTVLGRAPDCGIHLDHPGVSRHHVRLTPTEDGLLVEDLGGTTHEVLEVESPLFANHGVGEWTVPEGEYFVMGDNRDRSDDSRFWGTLPESQLRGKAFLVWMNFDSAAGGVDFDRIGTRL